MVRIKAPEDSIWVCHVSGDIAKIGLGGREKQRRQCLDVDLEGLYLAPSLCLLLKPPTKDQRKAHQNVSVFKTSNDDWQTVS